MSRFTISEFYGKNERPDISKLWVSIIMLLFSLGMFFVILTAEPNEVSGILVKWAFSYLSIFIFTVALFISSFYYYEKKEGSVKYKFIRQMYFLLTLMIFIIAFLPLTITFFVLNKLKMETLFRYSSLYGISLIISLLINTVLCIFLYSYLQIAFGDFADSMTICLTFLFIMNYFVLKLSGACYFYFSKVFTRRKKKLKEGIISSEKFDYLENRDRQVKEEFMSVIYVMNFAIIAIGSAAIYFVNLEKIFPDIPVMQLRQSILFSFALYTAFDRLWDKWKKSLGSDKKAQMENKVDMKSVEEELQSTT